MLRPSLASVAFFISSLPHVGAMRATAGFSDDVEKNASTSSMIWHACHRLITSQMPLKQYHFETTLRDYPHPGAEAHAALELGREVLSPYLQIYVNYVWLIQPSPTYFNSMLWIPSLKDSKEPRKHLAQAPTVEIELSKQVAHVHFNSAPEELTLYLKDGTNLTLANTKYLPQVLFEKEFKRKLQVVDAKHNDWRPTGSLTANLQGAALNPGVPANASLAPIPGDKAYSPAIGAPLVGGTPLTSNVHAALNHGIYKTAQYYDKAAWTSDKISRAEKDFHKAQLRDELVGGTLSSGFFMIPFGIWGGFVSSVGASDPSGIAPLIGLGAMTIGALPAILSIPAGMHALKKFERENSISGERKIFEKLRCHPLFKSCSFPSRSTNDLAPKYEPCQTPTK